MLRIALTILTALQAFGQGVYVNSYTTAATGNNLSTSLSAYWKMDETTGAPQDSSGNARHLTHYGTVDSSTGILVNARQFDSFTENDDYFDVASAAWNTFGSGDFSIGYWFKPSGAEGPVGDQVHIAKADINSTEVSWWIGIDAGGYPQGHAVVLYYSPTGSILDYTALATVNFQEVISINDWYCAVLTRVGNNFTLYLGKVGMGVFDDTDTGVYAGSLYNNSTTPLTIGCYLNLATPDTAQDTEGDIDEVAIWGRGLSQCEVYKFYNAGNARAFSTFDANPCL